MTADTRVLAKTAAYVNRDLPKVPRKNQYHVIVTADGSIYSEWQIRVVCEMLCCRPAWIVGCNGATGGMDKT